MTRENPTKTKYRGHPSAADPVEKLIPCVAVIGAMVDKFLNTH